MSSLLSLKQANPDIEMKIYRDGDFTKLHVSDMFNQRLGDKVGQSALVEYRRDGIPTSEAIICLDHVYNEIDLVGTYIKIENYFSHQYDAIARVTSKEQRDRICDSIKTIFPNWISVAAHLWEELIPIRCQGVYYTMHSWPAMDSWWGTERRTLGIPREYIACHIFTEDTYHPNKIMSYDDTKEVIQTIGSILPVVIIGPPVNPKIPNTNKIFDLSYNEYNIDQSIAIINGCSLFIGADTGTSHVAAALKKPLVQAFPGDDKWHTNVYDARPCVPNTRYRRVFIDEKGHFDKAEMIRYILEVY
jgi:hypothetical protein